MPRQLDASMLEMALIGYETERQKIGQKIVEIRGLLDGRASVPNEVKRGKRKKRHLSAAGRARIVAALKRRWAAKRKAEAAAKKPKEKMSAARKAALLANLKKARAAKAAKAK